MQPTHDDLYKVRHSLAHTLAQAVLKLWPDTQVTIGPPIDTGCYYDFLFSTPITDADFKPIEKEMRSIINKGQTFTVQTLNIADAIAFWQAKNQPFKVELIKDLAAKGETEVTHYTNVDADGNETFTDLCKGGHTENLNQIKADCFKIMSLAGAYWRGDETKPQLTRIYLAAFMSKEDLQAHLTQLEEAKRRDHRKLGQELDLFTFSERVGPGLPLFLPNGETMKYQLEQFMRELKEAAGYKFVTIPHIAKKELYVQSGHMGKYDAMMPVMQSADGDEYVVKPMNCPHHFELFNSRPHSYRQLPLRFAENTTCYRNEKTGELSGLTRVKALTQDDTHHFVRHDQIGSEIELILSIMEKVYTTFGLTEFKVDISVRDPANKSKYFGDDAVWSKAEATLIAAVQKWGVEYTVEEGEAAFYGPKIDIQVKDAIGRMWQLTTVQLDFVQPENFNMEYTGQDGKQHRPAVLHVAILGSSHRFLGVIIEHFAGVFPLWLTPIQIALLPVAQAHEAYAITLQQELAALGLRCELLDSSESLGKRIRIGEKQKIPYMLVLGDTEVNDKSVTVRNLTTKAQVTLSKAEFINTVTADVKARKLDLSIGE